MKLRFPRRIRWITVPCAVLLVVYLIYIGAFRFRAWIELRRLSANYGPIPIEAFSADAVAPNQRKLPDAHPWAINPTAPEDMGHRTSPIDLAQSQTFPGTALTEGNRERLQNIVVPAAAVLEQICADPGMLITPAADRFSTYPMSPWLHASADVRSAARLLYLDAVLALDRDDVERAKQNILTLFELAGLCAPLIGEHAIEARAFTIRQAAFAIERLIAVQPKAYPEIVAAIDRVRAGEFLLDSIKWDLAAKIALLNLPLATQSELVGAEFGEFAEYAPIVLFTYRAAGLLQLDKIYLLRYYDELFAAANAPPSDWSQLVSQLPYLPDGDAMIVFHYGAILCEDAADGVERELLTLTLLDLLEIALAGAGAYANSGVWPEGLPADEAVPLRVPPHIEGTYEARRHGEGWVVYVSPVNSGSQPMEFGTLLRDGLDPYHVGLDDIMLDPSLLVVAWPIAE